MPDFQGDLDAVSTVARSGLDVYAHNVETVRACSGSFEHHETHLGAWWPSWTIISHSTVATQSNSRYWAERSSLWHHGSSITDHAAACLPELYCSQRTNVKSGNV